MSGDAMRRLSFVTLVVVLLGWPARAQNIEGEARAIEALLVAPCCWTQQVSIHQSEAATRIKQDIRVALREGRTRDQILNAYVREYGPAILIEPPARGFGAYLYVLPVVTLLGSALLVGFVVRRFTGRSRTPRPPESAPEQQAGDRLSDRLDEELRDLD